MWKLVVNIPYPDSEFAYCRLHDEDGPAGMWVLNPLDARLLVLIMTLGCRAAGVELEVVEVTHD